MQKGRPPYPFETIALAVSFSPSLSLLIREMKRLCENHQAQAIFIHDGKKTGEKHRTLSHHLSENGFHDGNSRIYWQQEGAVDSLLSVCKEEIVDLLLIGASDRQDFKLPPGSTVRALIKKSKCSLLIYSDYAGNNFKKIMVNATEHRKTDLTIETALYFAEKEKAKSILIAEHTSQGEIIHREKSAVGKAEFKNIQKNISAENVAVNYLGPEDGNSFSVSEYAFQNSIDLIITNSIDHHLLIFDRIDSNSGLDTIFEKLPCSVLIVHSRSGN